MQTKKRLSKLFGVPDIWYKNKVRTDPFFFARIKITGIYFILGAVAAAGKGLFADYSIQKNLYEVAVVESGDVVRDAFALTIHDLWVQRIGFLLATALVAYIITGLVLKPIKKSAEIQKHFISVISHELRTPLTVMKNAIEVELRKKELFSKDKALSVLRSNLEEIEKISGTINFLVAFTLLKEREHIMSLQKVSLGEIIQDSVQLVNRRFFDRIVPVTVVVKAKNDVIEGDVAALKGMCVNVIENAVLHTAPDGKIEVSVYQENSQINLIIADAGSGIHKKDLPYIFEPFYRGSAIRFSDSNHTPMGIGLSLVKEVVMLHRAEINVSSTVGVGTTFKISFPTT